MCYCLWIRAKGCSTRISTEKGGSNWGCFRTCRVGLEIWTCTCACGAGVADYVNNVTDLRLCPMRVDSCECSRHGQQVPAQDGMHGGIPIYAAKPSPTAMWLRGRRTSDQQRCRMCDLLTHVVLKGQEPDERIVYS